MQFSRNTSIRINESVYYDLNLHFLILNKKKSENISAACASVYICIVYCEVLPSYFLSRASPDGHRTAPIYQSRQSLQLRPLGVTLISQLPRKGHPDNV